MPALVLGPMLRYVDATRATVWVEADEPCEVEIAGPADRDLPRVKGRTFTVADHHYAILVVEGLTPGEAVPYEVSLDGVTVWPAGGPPSVIVAAPAGQHRVRIAFGSCRVSAPTRDDAYGADALHALALRLREQPYEQWPALLLLVGDQVYADVTPVPVVPDTATRRKVGAEPAGDDRTAAPSVVTFEEYAQLYRQAWSVPEIRWLLSTIPSAMIFDDHEVWDDWNISAAWRDEVRALPWWQEKITSALMAYWLYQHLGNLDPDQLDALPLLAEVRATADGQDTLRRSAARADAAADTGSDIPVGGPVCGDPAPRWSFRRDLGGTRLIVVDSRCGRVLRGGERAMVDAREWAWVREQLTGGFDHLLIATSLPYLLPPAVHHVEAWSEPVCAGRWGARAARVGERLRRRLDLEHWASFSRSFAEMADLVAEVGGGARGPAPATIGFLSGDVHFSYLARATFRDRSAVRSAVYQAVCSPLRNPLDGRLRLMSTAATWRVPATAAALFARCSGVRPPRLRWRIDGRLSFANALAMLDLESRDARFTLWETDQPGRLIQARSDVLT